MELEEVAALLGGLAEEAGVGVGELGVQAAMDRHPERVAFIAHVPKTATPQDLLAHFSLASPLDAILAPPPKGGNAQGATHGGFGWVLFADAGGVTKALVKKGSNLLGQRIDVRPHGVRTGGGAPAARGGTAPRGGAAAARGRGGAGTSGTGGGSPRAGSVKAART
ncbi:hypothetical protein T484DRAFT_1955130 [Baffinella frigidus]|nr:hypothetical protein T484DRAFT_1955130 [Cryptophyta sp. CCMP2293]